MNLKEALKDRLKKEEIDNIVRSFEVIGNIAIINISNEIEDKKMLIAETLIKLHKNIKIVLNKKEQFDTALRVAKYEKLIGDDTETIHKENNCLYKLDPTKVYFSSKMAHERQIIVEQVKNKEKILCMFAGVGPFAISIAKNKDVKIIAVEINAKAVEYLIENIRVNKVFDKIDVIEGDVENVLPEIKEQFDRILMPAPKNAEDFLHLALTRVKKGGIINFYTFARDDELIELPKKIEQKCKKYNKKIKILDVRKCGSYAPFVNRIAVDFQVLD